jgi:hypothetical protein
VAGAQLREWQLHDLRRMEEGSRGAGGKRQGAVPREGWEEPVDAPGGGCVHGPGPLGERPLGPAIGCESTRPGANRLGGPGLGVGYSQILMARTTNGDFGT